MTFLNFAKKLFLYWSLWHHLYLLKHALVVVLDEGRNLYKKQMDLMYIIETVVPPTKILFPTPAHCLVTCSDSAGFR